MNRHNLSSIGVHDEFSTLATVIIGLGSPYQRDKQQAAIEMEEFPFVPDTARREQVLAMIYPTEEILMREYTDYIAALEKYGIEVLRPDPAAAYSFDYTYPRDIGFVIGDTFFVYTRLYGPEKAYFDQTFPMNKIKKMQKGEQKMSHSFFRVLAEGDPASGLHPVAEVPLGYGSIL